MITKEQYEAAIKAKDEADATINQYFKEKLERFSKRFAENPIFADDELVYAATARCACGAGLAYPKDCGPHHYWDCSDILTGRAVDGTAVEAEKHSSTYPFAFYEIHSESEWRGTTRPQANKPISSV